ncbi:phosphoenolpyruvate--protein phosphotransferase [Moorena sp. SIO2C4]|uniref:phosphoenolpyruvate--protein phosphotransferase n=1 Tax=Moorena sp. SIO2C4 TaxID=2607824 RepID=UPI00257FE9B0|nr:phosphoenolpyruvate--protein phosphotransferase [Moorena sp. SIO2C4]
MPSLLPLASCLLPKGVCSQPMIQAMQRGLGGFPHERLHQEKVFIYLMISIVIISHSAKLAAGVKELAEQMVHTSVPIAIAAGIDDPENPFGTDVLQVQAAIESVYSDAGVVVLMDLGSAVLSAEMALEFLDEDQKPKVRLCEAPLVEGAIAAVIQAAAGGDIDQVIAEARSALTAKASQLSVVDSNDSTEFDPVGGMGILPVGGTGILPVGGTGILPVGYATTTKEIHLTVQNQQGIHARPAAQFVTTANRFNSEITLRNISKTSNIVNGKSLNNVMLLGIQQGDEIVIKAVGEDSELALIALQQLVDNNFGEKLDKAKEDINQESNPASNRSLHPSSVTLDRLVGIPAAAGIAIGAVIVYQPKLPEIIEEQTDNPQAEWETLQLAIKTAQQQLQHLINTVTKDQADIFQAHLLYLDDPALVNRAYQIIVNQHLWAGAAWKTVIDETVANYQTLEDSYMQARGNDVIDVGWRVLRLLTNRKETCLDQDLRKSPLNPPILGDFDIITPQNWGAGGQNQLNFVSPIDVTEPGILVAADLTPSEVAQLNPSQVRGICCASGSATAHSSLIANMLGIPMVVGVGQDLLSLPAGMELALDGTTGQIWVEPSEERKQELQLQSNSKDELPTEVITQDGHKIPLMANVLGEGDAKLALDCGAQGIGLLRTEFLYLERLTIPSEEEQLATYQAIAEIMGTHPLTIRTLDIGGDKPIPFLNLASSDAPSARHTPEPNPFLGWRGIRQSLDCPEMLKIQLRAILRGSYGDNIKVMFPMVSSVEEVRAAKEILAEAKAELRQEGYGFNEQMPVGIMVEVPAAVTMADQLAAEVDFFSIGTNDLSQYVMAADRTNPKVAKLADALEPAVLRMIQQTVTVAHQAGIPVSVCGQLASNPVGIPILLGLGVDELSVNPPAIATVMSVISQLTINQAEMLAGEALQLDSAVGVREYIINQLDRSV